MSPRSLRWTRRRRRDDAGAAAVEFSFIAMILIVLVFGILQYGLYMWAMQAGSAAVRDGARRSAVDANCTGLDAYVDNRVGAAATGAVTVSRTFTNAEGNTDTTTAEVGDIVTVTVKFNGIDLKFPFIPLPANAEVTETAQSRVEYAPTPGGVC